MPSAPPALPPPPLARRHGPSLRTATASSGAHLERIDTLIIGAGVVGLAVARALALEGHEVVVLEAATAIGQGVSSRNSEVIHAGLYYPTGSLKARLCVRGRELLYAYAHAHGVGHARCGKLIVATSAEQHAALAGIEERARANGAPIERLSAGAAMALEPALHCTAALHSPSTGIVDSHALMLALQGDLERSGGVVALASTLEQVHFGAGTEAVARVRTAEGTSEVAVRQIVNAAGLHACALAARFSGLAAPLVPPPRYAKGSYFSLAARSPFSRLIYPVPVPGGLGVHLTLDLGGQAKFGPDVEWLEVATPEAIDYAVQPARAASFYAEVRRYWPALPDGALLPSYAGVRPKIHGPREAAADFRIDGPATHGIAGLVNLFGIESPGLTSCLAIGEYVAGLLGRP